MTVLALGATFFIKEIPLRRSNDPEPEIIGEAVRVRVIE